MALARVCDRCGKTTTTCFHSFSIEKCSFSKNREGYIDYSDKHHCELCPECMNKFVNFMSSIKKE